MIICLLEDNCRRREGCNVFQLNDGVCRMGNYDLSKFGEDTINLWIDDATLKGLQGNCN